MIRNSKQFPIQYNLQKRFVFPSEFFNRSWIRMSCNRVKKTMCYCHERINGTHISWFWIVRYFLASTYSFAKYFSSQCPYSEYKIDWMWWTFRFSLQYHRYLVQGGCKCSNTTPITSVRRRVLYFEQFLNALQLLI